ncbi:MAG: tRNA (guanosine(37)-N1)-methyltransferase TrmD, partial [Alphaproteobacteria bacterium]|nr:tRNA (guanosine(37)-N1)-methyltransferase TrmD [Alphaproteobacteria bacterium]
MFPGPLGQSLAGKALEQGIWSLKCTNIRDFGEGKHRFVDDTPAGGGPGMVMRADILGAAIDAVQETGGAKSQPLIYFSPRGRVMDQSLVKEVAAAGGASLICGRFEGVDERVLDAREVMEVSLGDFVLSGGEIAALALMDAVIRLLPGVLGDEEVLNEESFESGLLEYPHYTRPQDWEGREIPKVLLSGHHGEIAAWRKAQAEAIT